MRDLPSLLQAEIGDSYVIERELGRGGMAVVFLAKDVKHDRQVALKVIRPDIAAMFGTDRFLREIHLVARLSHPLILPLLDSGEAGGLPFYVMPYVRGGSLRHRLEQQGPLPVADAVRIAGEVADALGAAHDGGIVHRDVKPENILFADRHAQVTDFGIAKARSAGGDPRLSQTGLAIGTPVYMSPEQVMGETELDGRSDLYSLGIVLYEMLAGRPPFAGATIQDTIRNRLVEPVPPLRATRGGVPEHVELAVLRALARSPAARFATAGEFAAALSKPSVTAAAGTTTRALSEAETIAVRSAGDGAASARPVTGSAAGDSLPSVAVTPFVNMSSDPENEYLSDGIAEELINSLAQLRSVRVVGRTSSFAFKGRNIDVRAMGEQLNVGAVLMGSVRKAGHRLRVAVQLVNVADGFTVWSQRYDRDLQDVFEVQDEITAAIVEALRVKLLGEPRPVPARQPYDFDAYELYLRGRYFWSQRGQGLAKGLDCFQRALAIDPDFAPAHAGVADSHTLLGYYGFVPSREALPKAKAAALRAIDLDDALAEAHGSLGYVLLYWDRQPEAARREFERAIELNPAYAPARYWLAAYHMSRGRHEDAIAEDRRAVEIEPLSPFLSAHLAWVYYISRRPAEAMAWLEKALDLDPKFVIARRLTGVCQLALGRGEEAIVTLREAVALSERDPWLVSDLGRALAMSGQLPEAESLLAELQQRAASSHVPATHVAVLLAALGRLDEAVEALGRAVEDREPSCAFGMIEPHWDVLRSDPRFVALARTADLPGAIAPAAETGRPGGVRPLSG